MKKIYITENQENFLIKEFIQNGFSLAKLDSLNYPEEMIKYCQQTLGKEIGRGGSRFVFELGDDTVIKISTGETYQNKQEFNNNNIQSEIKELFPKVYQHAEDFSWIEVERVLPIKREDFVTILGYQWNWQDPRLSDDYEKYRVEPKNREFSRVYCGELENFKCNVDGFISWAEKKVNNQRIDQNENEAYEEVLNSNRWFQLLYKYIELCGGWNDLIFNNFGIAIRNGEPTIVILDNGYDRL